MQQKHNFRNKKITFNYYIYKVYVATTKKNFHDRSVEMYGTVVNIVVRETKTNSKYKYKTKTNKKPMNTLMISKQQARFKKIYITYPYAGLYQNLYI